MRKVLFVCTGNIFRSMVAEYALKQLLAPEQQEYASSAGIVATPQTVAPVLTEILQTRNIDVTAHKQRKLSAEMFRAGTLAIAMSTDHQAFMKEIFKHHAPLFNELCYGCSTPVLDLGEAYPDWRNIPPEKLKTYLVATVDAIRAGVPKLMEYIL